MRRHHRGPGPRRRALGDQRRVGARLHGCDAHLRHRWDVYGLRRVAMTVETVRRIGVVDTMFARYDMGAAARGELSECPGHGERFEVVSRTGPGVKDLAVAA